MSGRNRFAPWAMLAGFVALTAGIVVIGYVIPNPSDAGTGSSQPSSDTEEHVLETESSEGQRGDESFSGSVTPKNEPIDRKQRENGNKVFPPAQESVLSDYNLDDLEDVDGLLKEYGSMEALYRVATAEERLSLITYLFEKDLVREEIGNLLPIETDADLRSQMIVRVDPEGYFDDVDPDNRLPADQELMDLLDAPAASEIPGFEMVARMELSSVISENYGVQYTRRAMEAMPENEDVQFLGSILQVNLNQMTQGVTPEEVERAESRLYSLFYEAGGDQFDPMERVRAYYALFFASDAEATMQFYRERLEHEPNSEARGQLAVLLNNLEEWKGGEDNP